jgi:hypothetical protein
VNFRASFLWTFLLAILFSSANPGEPLARREGDLGPPCPEVTETAAFEWRCEGLAEPSRNFDVRLGMGPLPTSDIENYIDLLISENSTLDLSSCIAENARNFTVSILKARDEVFGTTDCKNRALGYVYAFQRSLGQRADTEASLSGVPPLRLGYELSGSVDTSGFVESALLQMNESPYYREQMDVFFSNVCGAHGAWVTSRQFLQEYLPDALPRIQERAQAIGREDCLNDLLGSVVSQASESLPSAEFCANPSERNRLICENSRSWVNEFVSQITPYLPTDARGSVAGLNACWSEGSADFTLGLASLGRSIHLAGQCIQPQVGESPRLVSTQATGLAAHFLLSRPSEEEHLAQLNLRFSPSDRDAEFRERATFCLDGFQDNLLGPNGQRLRIELPQDASSLPAALASTLITIQPDDYRANSSNWDADINCSTILHELLHLLGLVDEYEERWLGYHHGADGGLVKATLESDPGLSEYGCRSLGPVDSIMSNQDLAVTASRSRRPDGSVGSLLRPAHFRAITQPGCEAANRLYYACSQSAYDTRHAVLGKGCGETPPDACRDPEAWLR